MSDIKTYFDAELMAGDYLIENGDLSSDDSLKTAVVLSLFTDRRAAADDEIPDGSSDKRGWWGNALLQDQEQIGSRLWLLSREKQHPEVMARAKEYIEEALQWLVDDGIASSVTVEVANPQMGVLAFSAVIQKPDSSLVNFKYNNLWSFV